MFGCFLLCLWTDKLTVLRVSVDVSSLSVCSQLGVLDRACPRSSTLEKSRPSFGYRLNLQEGVSRLWS